MKYIEMKARTQKIDNLRKELEDIEFIINSKGFWQANFLTKTNGQISVGKSALNNILPFDMLKALAQARKSAIIEEIEEMEQ